MVLSETGMYILHMRNGSWDVVKTWNKRRAMSRFNPCVISLRLVFSPFVLFVLQGHHGLVWLTISCFYRIGWSCCLYTHKHFMTLEKITCLLR